MWLLLQYYIKYIERISSAHEAAKKCLSTHALIILHVYLTQCNKHTYCSVPGKRPWVLKHTSRFWPTWALTRNTNTCTMEVSRESVHASAVIDYTVAMSLCFQVMGLWQRQIINAHFHCMICLFTSLRGGGGGGGWGL